MKLVGVFIAIRGHKKIPAIKPGSGTFRIKYYASAPPSLSVFLSGLRPGIGRLDLLLR